MARIAGDTGPRVWLRTYADDRVVAPVRRQRGPPGANGRRRRVPIGGLPRPLTAGAPARRHPRVAVALVPEACYHLGRADIAQW